MNSSDSVRAAPKGRASSIPPAIRPKPAARWREPRHKSYNADRNITTGNPYRELVQDLMRRGVQIELCGATAKAHGWGNADLLPGVKVNTDAMARTTQLVQAGFVKITE